MPGIIIFDGNCPFCTSVVSFIKRQDSRNRFRFVTLQSVEGILLISRTGLPPKDTNSVIYFTEEKISIRSTAVLKILRELGGGWRIFYIFILIPGFIRDYFYRLIARNRHRFFRNQTFL